MSVNYDAVIIGEKWAMSSDIIAMKLWTLRRARELIVIDWKFTYSPKTFLNMNIPICITLLASFQLATSKIEAETVSRKDGINPGIITKASFM